MSNKNNNIQDLPLEAKALENANKSINSSTNKPLYILMVEDPALKVKYRYFATPKIDKMAGIVDIVGYEIETNAQINKIKTWDDAVELASKEKFNIVNMTFPWHRVISIRNVSYKSKSA